MAVPLSTVVGGGGIAVPASTIVGGGGMAVPASTVVGGGGMAVPASAVLGGAGIADPVKTIVGGGGIADPSSAVVGGGGGIAVLASAVLGGGGMTDALALNLIAPWCVFSADSVSTPATNLDAPGPVPRAARRPADLGQRVRPGNDGTRIILAQRDRHPAMSSDAQ